MTLWRYCVRRNVEPNIAKKMSMMPKLAAENRGFSNTWRLSIGWLDLSSHDANAPSTTTAITNAAMIVGARPALGRSFDDAVDQREQADDRQRPRRRGRAAGATGHATSGAGTHPRSRRDRDDRQVHEEDRAPVEVLEQESSADRPQRDADAGDRGPVGDRATPLFGREHVGDERQRARHDERAADSHDRPGRDQLLGRRGERREQRAGAEHDHAELQRTLAAEAVAEAARREQQTREHERVRVDHPLELAERRVEIASGAAATRR